jgi:hypothetical protein
MKKLAKPVHSPLLAAGRGVRFSILTIMKRKLSKQANFYG